MDRRRLAAIVIVALLAAACGTGASPSPSPSVGTTDSPTDAPDASPSIAATASPETPPTPAPTPAELRWTAVAAVGPSPAAREDHTWTADPATGDVWLFGGRDGGTTFDDLWRFDPAANAWHEVVPDGPRPDARFGHTGTWVPGHGLVVWSGQVGSTFFDDLWAYAPAANRWTELPAGGAVPPSRYGSCAALAPDGRLWVSHGFTADAGRFDDTRAYDFEAGSWSDISADGPVIRCLHDCLFTADGDFVLYAGQTTGAPAIGDLWTRPADGGWARGPESDAEPAPRQLYALAAQGDAAFVFGGGAADRSKLADLWRLDLADLSWTSLQPLGDGPAARSGATMAASPATGRLLLFGGTDGEAAFADLWSLPVPD